MYVTNSSQRASRVTQSQGCAKNTRQAEDRGWEVEVVPLVVGQRSVKEKEWLETLRFFGITKDSEDRRKIISRLRDRCVGSFLQVGHG